MIRETPRQIAERKLRLVDITVGVEPDIYAKMRAEIAARDWASVHVAADRRKPFARIGR